MYSHEPRDWPQSLLPQTRLGLINLTSEHLESDTQVSENVEPCAGSIKQRSDPMCLWCCPFTEPCLEASNDDLLDATRPETETGWLRWYRIYWLCRHTNPAGVYAIDTPNESTLSGPLASSGYRSTPLEAGPWCAAFTTLQCPRSKVKARP